MQKFNNYKMDVDNLNESEELLKSFDDATKSLIGVLKTLNKKQIKNRD